jgi:hypothetical protein
MQLYTPLEAQPRIDRLQLQQQRGNADSFTELILAVCVFWFKIVSSTAPEL